MPKKSTNKETVKSVDAIRHTDDKRKNIPTIEYRPMVSDDQQSPVPVKYPRNTDLDPQLVWRGKDEQDWSDLVVHAPPLYIQEKVHPKVLIDDDQGPEDLLHLVVEIKGYRGEDAKEKKGTMDTYWVPGVNRLGTYGRWAFAEFTDIYEIESEFAKKLASEFDQMIQRASQSAPQATLTH